MNMRITKGVLPIDREESKIKISIKLSACIW